MNHSARFALNRNTNIVPTFKYPIVSWERHRSKQIIGIPGYRLKKFAWRDMMMQRGDHNCWSLPLATIIVRKQMCEKELTIVTPEWQNLKINCKIITTISTLK